MPAGRPSKYDPAYCAQAEKLCKLGAKDDELADFFGVSIRTINQWKTEHEAFSQSLKNGKEEADARVEKSLYHRATGYTFDSEKIFNHQGEILRVPIREHVPPDTTAMIFWLKNRRPADWRDKHEVEHSGRIEASSMTDEQLEQVARNNAAGSSPGASSQTKGKATRH